MKTNVIKGTPIYVLRKSNYLEKPSNCKIKRMVYSEDENITYVYMKKNSIFVDLLLFAILVAITVFNIHLESSRDTVSIRYNNLCTYHNDMLYLNLMLDKPTTYSITFRILNNDAEVYSGILEYGDTVTSLTLPSLVGDKCNLIISVDNGMIIKEMSYSLTLQRRD